MSGETAIVVTEGWYYETLDKVKALTAQLEEVYADRNRLVLFAATLADEVGIDVGLIDDPAEPDWPVIAFMLQGGQVSWHVPRALLRGTEAHWPAMTYDGHTNDEKAQRILDYVFDEDAWPAKTLETE